MCCTEFKCKECQEVEKVYFNTGDTPDSPKCKKCGNPMKRLFKKIEIGDVIDDEMLKISRMMTFHSDRG